MIKINAMGDTCPIPVVKTKNAIQSLEGTGVVSTAVDNEIAVQNLTKMAHQKGYGVSAKKIAPHHFEVVMTIGDVTPLAEAAPEAEAITCMPDTKGKALVVISSQFMGQGSDDLGAILMKGFIYALANQDTLPATILFYNGGAKLTCEDAPTLEDLMAMEAQGVEILTCGTCLDHYGLTQSLKVGKVTNMYDIVEKMTCATQLITP